MRPRQPRRALAAALLALVPLAAVLASTVSGWFLVAVPFAVVAAYGAWLGLSGEELLEAVAAGEDDLGRGPAGISL
jgi:hypothetical protein